MELDPLEIARWQFGITTVYHFWMVPLTLGLGPIVVLFQSLYVRTGHARYKRMTKFWGKLFLINFIMGVATGIVQEFQFGLAWSEYSRFVGDVFGAPLAMEGLLAFFTESIFLGIWIFGWDRLPKKVHLFSLVMAVGASVLSAYFIIVANSWMQHPVGVELIDGRPVMNDIVAVLTNNTAVWAFTHAVFASLLVGGGFVVAIAYYHLWQRRRDGIDTVDENGKVVVGEAPEIPGRDRTDHTVWLRSLRIGAVIGILAFGGTALTGDFLGKLMYEQQPLKMASAEAACHTGTDFSVLSIGKLGSKDCDDIVPILEIPGMLSFLAKGDFTTDVPGINELLPVYEELYGTHLPESELYGERSGEPVDYLPLIEVTYWGFRAMIGFGGISALACLAGLWFTRKGTAHASKPLMQAAILSIAAPFIANTAGWVFTEMGRQPFVVVPNPEAMDGVFMFTAAALSPGVSAGEMLFSLLSFLVIYGVLLVVEIILMSRYVRGGIASAMPELGRDPDPADPGGPDSADRDDDVLSFAY
ncbi:cytochrome ubiquinol oxidase subunit I [Gulosibacter sp. 10]|uniref:cytochrome ubiquinol oxidase subunit I n=1 Tax=Gulosibacter sp. 10 TaxID=1255570 RepID=UPI00097EA0AC|nr:cytochrome ubiquinol oxidase subunit I [Gulosibacter sp. 10]SJM70520.1 Cytochrome d ubiquinol oxidase subunit I [Gulosibacter sp. 10]